VTRDGWCWIVDAHREGVRHIVHSDELLTADPSGVYRVAQQFLARRPHTSRSGEKLVSLITAATLSLTQRSGDETADYGSTGAVEANTADGGVLRRTNTPCVPQKENS